MRDSLKALALTWLLLMVGVANGAPGRAQEVPTVVQNTGWLTCWNKEFKDYKSRAVRSRKLVAPDGISRAYVRVDARATDNSGAEAGNCENRSALFVASAAGSDFQAVFVKEAVPSGPQGNGIQLVDWSADSRFLLADLLTWYYYSEGWEHNILIFSSKTRAVTVISLNSLFSKALKKDCQVDGQFRGFLKNGNLVFESRPFPVDEGETEPCDSRPVTWAVNWETGQVSELTGRHTLPLAGHYEEGDRLSPSRP